MSDSNRNTIAHPAHTSIVPNPFTRKSINRLRTNLAWLSSAIADQSLTAGRLSVSPGAAELSEISERLEAIAERLGVAS